MFRYLREVVWPARTAFWKGFWDGMFWGGIAAVASIAIVAIWVVTS